MERWEGKVAVITGASSGIGAAICMDLVRAGLIVVGLARQVYKIEKLKSQLVYEPGKLHCRFCDLTNDESIEAAFNWIEERLGGVNILINNAGQLKCSLVLAQDNEKDLRQVMDTNFYGTLFCTKAAYRMMKKHDADGHIVMINSLMGHVSNLCGTDPVPLINVFPPSKAAVLSLTEIIREELNVLNNRKVKISSVSPSLVSTGFFKNGGFPSSHKVFENFMHLKPQDISDAVMFILGTKPNVQIHELIVSIRRNILIPSISVKNYYKIKNILCKQK